MPTEQPPAEQPPTLGATLRAWREHRGLSLTDVTTRAGMGPEKRSWLSRVERNGIRSVSREKLQALASVLQIPYSALRAGNLPAADATPAPIAPPPGSHAARRRASPQAIMQQTVEELRDDVRVLSQRLDDLSQRLDDLSQRLDENKQLIHVLLSEFSTVNLSRAATAHWYAPPLAPRADAESAPDGTIDDATDSAPESAQAPDALSSLAVLSEPPRPAAPDLKAEWRAAVERIHSYASQAPARSPEKPTPIEIGGRLITIHQQSRENFARSMAGLDALSGDRCLLLDGISECFVPLSVHQERGQELLKDDVINQPHFAQLLYSRTQRFHAMENHLRKPGCRVRDLYTWQAIERLVETGYYALDDRFAALGARPLTNQEIVATLDNITGYIEGFRDTYEVRFIDDPQPDWPFYWMVKEEAYLLIELWVAAPATTTQGARQDGALAPYKRAAHWATHARSPYSERELAIHDTQTARLFHRYFMEELWNDVPVGGRDRATLLRRLNDKKRRVSSRTI